MEHAAALIGTVLWVALIAGLVWRFHDPVYGILSALQKRIDSGSSLKAGPFELQDQLKPSSPEAQRVKVETETAEAAAQAVEGTAAPRSPASIAGDKRITLKAFLSEDLALRTIQAEYGALVQRQVSAGPNSRIFDGFLLNNGRPTVVEVRFIRERASVQRLGSSLERIAAAIQSSPWPNAQLLLALVLEHETAVPDRDRVLRNLLASVKFDVQARIFFMPELLRRFGLPTDVD